MFDYIESVAGFGSLWSEEFAHKPPVLKIGVRRGESTGKLIRTDRSGSRENSDGAVTDGALQLELRIDHTRIEICAERR